VIRISLEVVAGKEYASLRKRFLKEAKSYYGKEVWSQNYFKALALTGMAVGVGGTALTYFSDSILCVIPAGAGLINMVQAYVNKEIATRELVSALERKTANLNYAELEERVKSRNYELPDMSEDDLKGLEMDTYSLNVVSAVSESEFKSLKYPWTPVGIGLMCYGLVKSMSSPAGGGITMAIGGIMCLGSSLWKKRKIAKIFKQVNGEVKRKGYDYFDNYLRKKDPLVFYKYHVLKEKD